MANLAIKGHATRGKEVIELLEMLGGINSEAYRGFHETWAYFISENKDIDWVYYNSPSKKCFTLEEFLEKYPYKVGDKVLLSIGGTSTIKSIYWSSKTNSIRYKVNGIDDYDFYISTLQPYKEGTIQLVPVLDKDTNKILYYTDEKNGIKYVPMEETTLHLVDGYVFMDENGNVIDTKKVTLTKKKPQYPKTYEECCKIISTHIRNEVIGHKWWMLRAFQKLLICRDAYWKIAGEEMGLDKSWEPDWNSGDQERYGIIKLNDNGYQYAESTSFVFPTEEMRDAFYENFKELIETCKELL